MSEDLPSSGRGREPTRKRSRKESARLVVVATVSALVALFAVLNLDEVEVNWIIGTFDTPLIVVIAVSVLVGAALGYVAARRRTGP
jgi:uncharacterized integral membrane protein